MMRAASRYPDHVRSQTPAQNFEIGFGAGGGRFYPAFWGARQEWYARRFNLTSIKPSVFTILITTRGANTPRLTSYPLKPHRATRENSSLFCGFCVSLSPIWTLAGR